MRKLEEAPHPEPTPSPLASVRDTLAQLARSQGLFGGDLAQGLAQLTEASSRALGVERASIWRFTDDLSTLECLDLYERTPRRHSSGLALHASRTPRYFAALHEVRSIPAHDARTDPRTSEFAPDYLEPNGIGAMLDAPILIGGRLFGVFCHEHVGPARSWEPWEELLAGTFADFMTMLLGAAERAEQARALDEYRGKLEQLVEERTRQLGESEESFRRLFDAAPVALVVSRLSDSQVLAANPSAAALFGVPAELAEGEHGPDYWSNLADRERLIEHVRRDGRVDGFEATLRMRDGRDFQGEIAVRSITFERQRALLFGVRDVTAQKQAALALQQSRETLRTMLEAAPTPMVVTSLEDATVRFCNQRAGAMFELEPSELVGRGAPDFYEHPDDRRTFIERLNRDSVVEGYVVRLVTSKGRGFWAMLNARTLVLEGERVFMVGFADLTEQKQVEQRLWNLATTDALTGLLNRRRFLEIAEDELLRARRYGRSLAVALFDLDHFKSVNDRFGHAVGDEALRLASRLVRGELRVQDQVGRYGGEELVVLFPETVAEDARAVAERIRLAIAGACLVNEGVQVPLSLSAGVAAAREGETLGDLLSRADGALYAAKAAGRDRTHLAP